MPSKQPGFMQCMKCNVWGYIPDNFRETKHFGKCPKCSSPMYLARSYKPEQLALQEKDKVTVGLMLHKEAGEDINA